MTWSPDEVDDEPTPGEKLLYVLGQLYLYWHEGLDVCSPQARDVEDLARMIGLWREVEFLQEDSVNPLITHLHFPGEVLVIDRGREYPWRLLDVWEWAKEREYEDLIRELEEWESP